MMKTIIIIAVSVLMMCLTIMQNDLPKMWTGTAIIGSGQLVIGLGAFLGHFPTLFRPTMLEIDELNSVNAGYLGYVVAFIFFVIIGAIVQRRLTKWQWIYDDQMDESVTKKAIF